MILYAYTPMGAKVKEEEKLAALILVLVHRDRGELGPNGMGGSGLIEGTRGGWVSKPA